MEKEINFFKHLRSLGVCNICAFRYLCKKNVDQDQINEYLSKHGLSDELNKAGGAKRIKTNPCCVCLGLLQNETVVKILESDKLLSVKEYDSLVFTCSISMPASILLREESLKVYIKDNFSDFYEDDGEMPLNRAWKMFIKNKLADHLGKEFENSDICNFSINILMDYCKDIEELDSLKKMQPQMYEVRSTQRRKYNGEIFSRKGVLAALSETDSKIFKANYHVPPQIPSDFLFLKDIECKHDPVYFAGKYLKFSRELSQSPWIIDGVKSMETSVQEIIFDAIKDVFNISEDNLKFSSSGREDCDVRCLGKGRPFYVEILDPTKSIFSFSEYRELEKEINQSNLIKVLHLQTVQRTELGKIKEGEETKTKDYNAICLCKDPVTKEQIDKLNSYGKVDILQKTPIRVLHRRPLAVRNRAIYKMEAAAVKEKPHLINLNLTTQAGTYVKEFVHGDFGRTVPNVAQIIGTEVDIIALDVTAINLDWPEEIKYDLTESNVT